MIVTEILKPLRAGNSTSNGRPIAIYYSANGKIRLYVNHETDGQARQAAAGSPLELYLETGDGFSPGLANARARIVWTGDLTPRGSSVVASCDRFTLALDGISETGAAVVILDELTKPQPSATVRSAWTTLAA